MRYWDNDKDRHFDEAIDEMIKEQLNEEAQAAEWRANIGNPSALYGAI